MASRGVWDERKPIRHWQTSFLAPLVALISTAGNLDFAFSSLTFSSEDDGLYTVGFNTDTAIGSLLKFDSLSGDRILIAGNSPELEHPISLLFKAETADTSVPEPGAIAGLPTLLLFFFKEKPRMTFSRRQLLSSTGYVGLGLAASHLGRKPVWAQALPSTKQVMPLTMQLDWKFNVQFAGLLLADERGLYADENVAVTLEPWESGIVVPNVVAQNPEVIGCAEQNLVLAAQAAGAPIKAVATMFQASPLGLMTLPDAEISSLENLVGKKVGVHVDGLAVMELVQGASDLEPEAIDVVEIPYENKFELLLSGECAAIQCYAVDEPIAFTAQTEIVPDVLKLADYGYEAYAQVIFVNNTLIETDPERISGFLRGTFGGWRLALEDIPAAATSVVENYVEPGSKYEDVAYQTQSLELIADYMMLGIETDALGVIDSDRWIRMAQRFVDYGIIENAPTLEASLSSDFWPITAG